MGNGDLQHDAAHRLSAVVCQTRLDGEYLEELLAKVGLVQGIDWSRHHQPSTAVWAYSIANRDWVAYFAGEYAIADKSPDGKSAQRFFDWVLRRLDRAQARVLIDGLERVGREAHEGGQVDAIADDRLVYTSSVDFRDRLMQLGLHAGYATRFFVHTRAGVDSASPVDHWAVSFSEQGHTLLSASEIRFDGGRRVARNTMECTQGGQDAKEAAQSIAPSSDSIGALPYDAPRDGRPWCVRVHHPDALIVAQRIFTDARGVVTKASTPVVVGNCLDIILEHDDIWRDKIRSKRFEAFNREWLQMIAEQGGGQTRGREERRGEAGSKRGNSSHAGGWAVRMDY